MVRLDRDRLRLLNNSHPALWVSEPPVLGGFGLQAEDGSLYNEDTLRFFRIVSLLRDAELLQDFQASTPPRTVWEIGGGWGGFAHYFKTLFPRVTYLISGPPSLLLLSATYVMTLFPEACVRFFHPSDPDAFSRDWQTVDFAFAPEAALERLQPASVSLTVDFGMLEQMGPSRIGDHVRRAFDLGCRYIVSTSSNRVPESTSAVRMALERWYWPHPMSVPAYLVRRFALRSGAVFLGWKRLLA
jgi:hypothetical protein